MTAPLFDCHGDHTFQFGACIYCDAPAAQQPTEVLSACLHSWLPAESDGSRQCRYCDWTALHTGEIVPPPSSFMPADRTPRQFHAPNQAPPPAGAEQIDPIAYAMADGWQPLPEDPTVYTHTVIFDSEAPFFSIAELAAGVEPAELDRRLSATAAMLSDRLTSALAEIDDLRAANHAHAIASEDLGRRLELAEADRGDDLEQRGKFVELQHRFAALASDYRDRGEALGDLQAELNREREARRELIVRTPSDHHHDGPTRNGMAIAELRFRMERAEHRLDELDAEPHRPPRCEANHFAYGRCALQAHHPAAWHVGAGSQTWTDR